MDQFPADQKPRETVRSPFAGTRSTIHKTRLNRQTQLIRVGIGLIIVVVVALIIFLSASTLGDPLRTLRVFPTNEYYSNHSALEGTRYRAELKVVEQLGWNENQGRIVVATLPEGSPIAVMLPQKFETISLSPGDQFGAEILVGNGGLLRADFLKKH